MTIPDQNILTELTTAFKTSAENAISLIMPYSSSLLIKLITLSIIVSALLWIVNRGVKYNDLPGEFMRYASFTFFVVAYKDIINAFTASFFKIGGLVGGSSISEGVFSSPSAISETGLNLMMPIWNNYVTENIGKIMVDLAAFIAGAATGGAASIAIKAVQVAAGAYKPNSILLMLLMLLITLIVILCFFIMAINVFVVQIEFAIVASLTLILIPCGVFNPTSFIFDNAKHNLLNHGIKFMVLTTILSISIGLLQNITLPTSPSYQQLLYFLVEVMALTAITIFVPNKIAAEI